MNKLIEEIFFPERSAMRSLAALAVSDLENYGEISAMLGRSIGRIIGRSEKTRYGTRYYSDPVLFNILESECRNLGWRIYYHEEALWPVLMGEKIELGVK